MNDFKLSIYQENILKNIANNKNLLVDAKAGSGKTSTLILIAKELIKNDKKCLFLAFNKSIVEELQKKINSPNIIIKTVHSLGLSFIKSYLYKKHNKNYDLQVLGDRNVQLVEDYFKIVCEEDFKRANFEMSKSDYKDLYYSVLNELTSLVNYCRAHNVNYHDRNQVIETMLESSSVLVEYSSLGLSSFPLVIEKTIDQIKYLFENPIKENNMPKYIIDYTDMIYLPIYYKMSTPYSLKDFLDCILVDEVQDLSTLQQLFIKKLNIGSNKFILMGDKKQAIYGFAGSDTKSVENLKKNFTPIELPLNICYRCPENVIKLAKTIVPDIEWNKEREDKGIVEFTDFDDVEDQLDSNSMIIARKNKDLIAIYKKFCLDKKIKIKFKNLELVKSLGKEINNIIRDYLLKYNKGLNIQVKLHKMLAQQGIKEEVNSDAKKYIEKCRKELIKAKQNSIQVINKSNYTLDYLNTAMKDYKEQGDYNFDSTNPCTEYFSIISSFIDLFKRENSSIYVNDLKDYILDFLKGNFNEDVPVLSSVHCMKGGEADNVFIYNYPDFPYYFKDMTEEQQQQELNLQYVAITRAKKKLFLIRLNDDSEMSIQKNNECRINVSKLMSM